MWQFQQVLDGKHEENEKSCKVTKYQREQWAEYDAGQRKGAYQKNVSSSMIKIP